MLKMSTWFTSRMMVRLKKTSSKNIHIRSDFCVKLFKLFLSFVLYRLSEITLTHPNYLLNNYYLRKSILSNMLNELSRRWYSYQANATWTFKYFLRVITWKSPLLLTIYLITWRLKSSWIRRSISLSLAEDLVVCLILSNVSTMDWRRNLSTRCRLCSVLALIS